MNNLKTMAALAAVMLAGLAAPMATAHPDPLTACDPSFSDLATLAPSGWTGSLSTGDEATFKTDVPDGTSKNLRLGASADGLRYEVYRLVDPDGAGELDPVCVAYEPDGIGLVPTSTGSSTDDEVQLSANDALDGIFYIHIYFINEVESPAVTLNFRAWRDG